MAEIAAQTLVKAGTKPTYAQAAASDTARCGSGYFLIVKNAGGSPITVGITVPGNNTYGEANPDPSWTVAATTGEVWIPLIDAYIDPADSRAHITYSGTTSVTRAVVKR